MTEPATIAVAGVALGVALIAGWAMVPSPPVLDGERWFKLILATLLRGRVEREGGDAQAWERRVVRFVPYHPAGRLPEQKVIDPQGYRPPGLSVPGELGLVEALARRSGLSERWRRLYDEDESALEARLQDPAGLGAAYDPAARLGPGGSWDDLADWGAGDGIVFLEACRRRLDARWAVLRAPAVRGMPDLVGALGALAQAVEIPVAEPRAVREALEGLVPHASDRLVVVAEGHAAGVVLRALVDAPDLRDRLLACLVVGGVLQGEPALDDWMASHFSARSLDTEVNRVTPYLSVTWLDRGAVPPGVVGLPVASARFPAPAATERVPSSVETVDLGLLPADPELPVETIAQGLYALVTLWVLTRRA